MLRLYVLSFMVYGLVCLQEGRILSRHIQGALAERVQRRWEFNDAVAERGFQPCSCFQTCAWLVCCWNNYKKNIGFDKKKQKNKNN